MRADAVVNRCRSVDADRDAEVQIRSASEDLARHRLDACREQAVRGDLQAERAGLFGKCDGDLVEIVAQKRLAAGERDECRRAEVARDAPPFIGRHRPARRVDLFPEEAVFALQIAALGDVRDDEFRQRAAARHRFAEHARHRRRARPLSSASLLPGRPWIRSGRGEDAKAGREPLHAMAGASPRLGLRQMR